jgi:hypothetical protein
LWMIENRVSRFSVAQEVDQRNLIGLRTGQGANNEIKIGRGKSFPTVRPNHRRPIMSIVDARWQAFLTKKATEGLRFDPPTSCAGRSISSASCCLRGSYGCLTSVSLRSQFDNYFVELARLSAGGEPSQEQMDALSRKYRIK